MKIDKSFYSTLKKAKLKLLEFHYISKTGHIGGNFSSIDTIMTIQHLLMKGDDKFILSKGHSAGSFVYIFMEQRIAFGRGTQFIFQKR